MSDNLLIQIINRLTNYDIITKNMNERILPSADIFSIYLTVYLITIIVLY